jgi:hypothetical protein
MNAILSRQEVIEETCKAWPEWADQIRAEAPLHPRSTPVLRRPAITDWHETLRRDDGHRYKVPGYVYLAWQRHYRQTAEMEGD